MKKEQANNAKEQLESLVTRFCNEKLDDEYCQLCLKMVDALENQAGSPFCRGSLFIWAAAIVYTIGRNNFLYDKSFEPYIPSKAIHDYFGTKPGTVSAKSNAICDMLGIVPLFDPKYSTKSSNEANPLYDYVMVDGLICPIDMLPPELHEKVKEARRGEDITFTTNRKED